MPTTMLSSIVEGDWKLIAIVATSFITIFAGRFLYLRKYRADINKTEGETRKADIEVAISILDRLPDFLRRLEDAHKKTLADETTIEKLKNELEKCVDGEASCYELKVNLLVFLTAAEPVIEKIEACAELLAELRRLKRRLE